MSGKHNGSTWRTSALLGLSGIQQQSMSKEKGLGKQLTDKQRSKTKAQYTAEGGTKAQQRMEFTGDKPTAGGDPAKKELSAWRSQADRGRQLAERANPNQVSALRQKPSSWRALGSALLNDRAGRAEMLVKHDLDGLGAEPEYSSATSKTGRRELPRQPSIWRAGAVFESRKTGRPAVVQTVTSWGRLRETPEGQRAMLVLSPTPERPTMMAVASREAEASMVGDRRIVVAYRRPDSEDAQQLVVAPLSEFIQSFKYRTARNAPAVCPGCGGPVWKTGDKKCAKCSTDEGSKKDTTTETETTSKKESVLQRGWRALTGLVGGQKAGAAFEGAAPPFGSPEREEWESGGKKSKPEGEDEGEGDEGASEVEDEASTSESAKQVSALQTLQTIYNVGGKHLAGVEFTKKPDGQINISVEADPAGGMGTADVVNGQPVPPAPAPAQPATPAPEAPEAQSPTADGQQGLPPGPVKPPKKAARAFTLVVGQQYEDPQLGTGVIDSIDGQTVIASFGGQRYQTTLSALSALGV